MHKYLCFGRINVMYFFILIFFYNIYYSLGENVTDTKTQLISVNAMTVKNVAEALRYTFDIQENQRIQELKERLKKIDTYVVDKDKYFTLISNGSKHDNLNETKFYDALLDTNDSQITNETKPLYVKWKVAMNRDDVISVLAKRGAGRMKNSARRMLASNYFTLKRRDLKLSDAIDKFITESSHDKHKFALAESITNYWDPTAELLHKREYYDPQTRRVFHGEPTIVKKFPFMVTVHVLDQFWCGGVLYWMDLVITSAACLQLLYNNRLYRENPSMLAVRVASNFTTVGGEKITALEVYFHPSYDPRTLDSNIALIRLKYMVRVDYHRAPKLIAISHSPQQVPNNDKILLLGWGVTKEGNKLNYVPMYLKKLVVPVYPFKFCQEIYGEKFITQNMFCGGTISTGEGACSHDAGGPAILEGKLVGIISFGPAVCGFPDAPTVFTRVGVFADWIETVNESIPAQYRGRKAKTTLMMPNLLSKFMVDITDKTEPTTTISNRIFSMMLDFKSTPNYQPFGSDSSSVSEETDVMRANYLPEPPAQSNALGPTVMAAQSYAIPYTTPSYITNPRTFATIPFMGNPPTLTPAVWPNDYGQSSQAKSMNTDLLPIQGNKYLNQPSNEAVLDKQNLNQNIQENNEELYTVMPQSNNDHPSNPFLHNAVNDLDGLMQEQLNKLVVVPKDPEHEVTMQAYDEDIEEKEEEEIEAATKDTATEISVNQFAQVSQQTHNFARLPEQVLGIEDSLTNIAAQQGINKPASYQQALNIDIRKTMDIKHQNQIPLFENQMESMPWVKKHDGQLYRQDSPRVSNVAETRMQQFAQTTPDIKKHLHIGTTRFKTNDIINEALHENLLAEWKNILQEEVLQEENMQQQNLIQQRQNLQHLPRQKQLQLQKQQQIPQQFQQPQQLQLQQQLRNPQQYQQPQQFQIQQQLKYPQQLQQQQKLHLQQQQYHQLPQQKRFQSLQQQQQPLQHQQSLQQQELFQQEQSYLQQQPFEQQKPFQTQQLLQQYQKQQRQIQQGQLPQLQRQQIQQRQLQLQQHEPPQYQPQQQSLPQLQQQQLRKKQPPLQLQKRQLLPIQNQQYTQTTDVPKSIYDNVVARQGETQNFYDQHDPYKAATAITEVNDLTLVDQQILESKPVIQLRAQDIQSEEQQIAQPVDVPDVLNERMDPARYDQLSPDEAATAITEMKDPYVRGMPVTLRQPIAS